MSIFQFGDFTLHSGNSSNWKIECDFLNKEDFDTLAYLVHKFMPSFKRVEGVPNGGLRFAESLEKYCVPIAEWPLLIVDDVLTTGNSMNEYKGNREAIGLVIFSRGKNPFWVTSIFDLNEELKNGTERLGR